jgi:hypothetical protein
LPAQFCMPPYSLAVIRSACHYRHVLLSVLHAGIFILPAAILTAYIVLYVSILTFCYQFCLLLISASSLTHSSGITFIFKTV